MADAIDAVDQPLWYIERWWETTGWIVSDLQKMEVISGKLKQVRPQAMTMTFARAVAILNAAKKTWKTFDKSGFRLRNVRTKDIVMGAIL